MKSLRPTFITVVLAAAVTMPLILRYGANEQYRARNEALDNRLSLVRHLSSDNERLSNALTQAASQAASEKDLSELAKLRNEAAQLRATLKEMEKLQSENDRLGARWKNLADEIEEGPEKSTALLSDVMERRKARVAQLKEWLDENPNQKIPELQSLLDIQWLAKVEQPLITDEDYLEMASLLRCDAEALSCNNLFKALKAYSNANGGQFPTDLSQLQPYFATPVDDAVLQRYEIVPPNTLCDALAKVGGDWVITQKAPPINPQMDMRSAIGSRTWISTGSGQGVWNPPQGQ